MALVPGTEGDVALGPGWALVSPEPWNEPGLYQRAGMAKPSGVWSAQAPAPATSAGCRSSSTVWMAAASPSCGAVALASPTVTAHPVLSGGEPTGRRRRRC